jgi:hypothetical protein
MGRCVMLSSLWLLAAAEVELVRVMEMLVVVEVLEEWWKALQHAKSC